MANMELSIRGLYLADNTIFDSLVIPSQLDHDTAVATILLNCSELEVLYPDPDMMKESIGYWSARRTREWAMIYASLYKEDYDPFTDYDRNEEYSATSSSAMTEQVRGYNEEALQNAAGSSGNITNSHTIHQYGNSALGTNQDIITKEIELRQKFEIYDIIADEFKKDFCLAVY